MSEVGEEGECGHSDLMIEAPRAVCILGFLQEAKRLQDGVLAGGSAASCFESLEAIFTGAALAHGAAEE